MSCLNCEETLRRGDVAYYRWKTENIAVSGCSAHLKEIFTVLNEAQGVPNVTLTSEMPGICKEVQAIKDERDRLKGEVVGLENNYETERVGHENTREAMQRTIDRQAHTLSETGYKVDEYADQLIELSEANRQQGLAATVPATLLYQILTDHQSAAKAVGVDSYWPEIRKVLAYLESSNIRPDSRVTSGNYIPSDFYDKLKAAGKQ